MFEVIKRYPFKEDLSNDKLTKLIYLIDWRHVLNHNRQVTQINWYFDNYGPYVQDVIETARSNNNLFEIRKEKKSYDKDKNVIYIKDMKYQNNTSEKVIASINHVIDATKNMTWNEFIRLVYSTYPVFTSEKYTYLDLVEKAKIYKSFDD